MKVGFILMFVWFICSVSNYLEIASHRLSVSDKPMDTSEKAKAIISAISQTTLTMLPFIFMVDW